MSFTISDGCEGPLEMILRTLPQTARHRNNQESGFRKDTNDWSQDYGLIAPRGCRIYSTSCLNTQLCLWDSWPVGLPVSLSSHSWPHNSASTMNQEWTVWPLEYSSDDSVWHWSFCLVSGITSSAPCQEHMQAALWRNPHEEAHRAPAHLPATGWTAVETDPAAPKMSSISWFDCHFIRILSQSLLCQDTPTFPTMETMSIHDFFFFKPLHFGSLYNIRQYL